MSNKQSGGSDPRYHPYQYTARPERPVINWGHNLLPVEDFDVNDMFRMPEVVAAEGNEQGPVTQFPTAVSDNEFEVFNLLDNELGENAGEVNQEDVLPALEGDAMFELDAFLANNDVENYPINDTIEGSGYAAELNGIQLGDASGTDQLQAFQNPTLSHQTEPMGVQTSLPAYEYNPYEHWARPLDHAPAADPEVLLGELFGDDEDVLGNDGNGSAALQGNKTPSPGSAAATESSNNIPALTPASKSSTTAPSIETPRTKRSRDEDSAEVDDEEKAHAAQAKKPRLTTDAVQGGHAKHPTQNLPGTVVASAITAAVQTPVQQPAVQAPIQQATVQTTVQEPVNPQSPAQGTNGDENTQPAQRGPRAYKKRTAQTLRANVTTTRNPTRVIHAPNVPLLSAPLPADLTVESLVYGHPNHLIGDHLDALIQRTYGAKDIQNLTNWPLFAKLGYKGESFIQKRIQSRFVELGIAGLEALMAEPYYRLPRTNPITKEFGASNPIQWLRNQMAKDAGQQAPGKSNTPHAYSGVRPQEAPGTLGSKSGGVPIAPVAPNTSFAPAAPVPQVASHASAQNFASNNIAQAAFNSTTSAPGSYVAPNSMTSQTTNNEANASSQVGAMNDGHNELLSHGGVLNQSLSIDDSLFDPMLRSNAIPAATYPFAGFAPHQFSNQAAMDLFMKRPRELDDIANNRDAPPCPYTMAGNNAARLPSGSSTMFAEPSGIAAGNETTNETNAGTYGYPDPGQYFNNSVAKTASSAGNQKKRGRDDGNEGEDGRDVVAPAKKRRNTKE